MNAQGNDGWAAFLPMDMALDLMYEDCYVVTQYGSLWIRAQRCPAVCRPTEASRHHRFRADQFMDGPTYAAATARLPPKINVNGMWFQNNGLSAKARKSLLQAPAPLGAR